MLINYAQKQKDLNIKYAQKQQDIIVINVKNKEIKENNIDIFHKGSILSLQINSPDVFRVRRNNFGQVSAKEGQDRKA